VSVYVSLKMKNKLNENIIKLCNVYIFTICFCCNDKLKTNGKSIRKRNDVEIIIN